MNTNATQLTDTTGTRVMRTTDQGITIATDGGHYPNTVQKYNCRILTGSTEIQALWSFNAPEAAKELIDTITARGGYGSAWGSGSILFPITKDEEARLIEISDKWCPPFGRDAAVDAIADVMRLSATEVTNHGH